MYLVEEARTRYRTAEGAMREEEQRRRKRRIRMARELAAERAAGKQKGGGGGSGPATAPTAGQKSSGTQLQGPRSTVVLGSGDGQLRQNEEKEEDEDDEEEDEEEEDEEDEEGEDEEEEDEEDEDGDTVLHQHQQQQQQQQQEQHVGAGVAGVTRGVSGEAEEKAEWDSAGGDGDGGRPSQQGADRVDAVPSGAEITAATPDGAVGAVFAGDDVSARSADSEATDLAAYDEDEDAAALQPLLLDDETEAFDPERARRVDDQYNAMELGEVEVRWQSRGKAGAVKKGVYGSSDRMRRVLMNWATQADVSTGQVDLLFIPHRLRTLRRWDQVKSAMEQVTRAKQLADAL